MLVFPWYLNVGVVYPRVRMEKLTDKLADKQIEKANGKLYSKWTNEQSNELLVQLVEAARQGLWITNRRFTKHIIENRVLPKVNSKWGRRKTYLHYQSRWRWFKKRYHTYRELLRSNSRFRWDPILKKFTAPKEVWDDFCRSYPKSAWVLTKSVADYPKLCFLFRGVVVDGETGFSLRGGSQPPSEVHEENDGTGSIVPAESDASNNIVPIVDSTTRVRAHSVSIRDAAGDSQSMPTRKRTKSFFNKNNRAGGRQSAVEEIQDKLRMDLLDISQSLKRITSILVRKNNINSWNDIMEIPELGMDTRFAVADLLLNEHIKDMFHTMTLEKRLRWIKFKLKLA